MSQEVPRDESEPEDDFADAAEDFEAEGGEEGFDEDGEEGDPDNFYEDDFSLALNDEALEDDQVRVSLVVFKKNMLCCIQL